MFLEALTSALGGAVGHFNPLLVGVLVTLGLLLLRPSGARPASRRQGDVPSVRRDWARSIDVDEQAEPVRQRAVAGSRRSSMVVPPPDVPARRKPPRGGGLFLLLVGGLATG